jgi:hypothetical protein
MSARFYAAGEGSGSVASDKSFQAREQGQEAFYIKQQEREQLEKMRAKAKQELEAKQAEVVSGLSFHFSYLWLCVV